MIVTIARHELRSLFLSPLAWVMLALVQLLLAYIFLLNIDSFIAGQDELALNAQAPGATLLVVIRMLGSVPMLLMVVIPLITMRLLSDEKRLRTRVLLLSSPVSMSAIVLGKYLAVMAFFSVSWFIIALMAISLNFGTALDLGHIATALLAIGLFTMALVAIGLYMSSLTSQSAIAAMATFALVLLLWIVDSGVKLNGGDSMLSHLSMSHHYQTLLRGLLALESVAYFLLVATVFLLLTVRQLHRERVYG